MPMCMYTLKDLDDSEFIDQEHVISACIGGMHKLPKGYVSNEANSMFSKLEREFARESPIAFCRWMEGPGKRGSLNPKKATVSKISLVKDTESGVKGLGYIAQGKPYNIDYICFADNSSKVTFSFAPDTGKPNQELILSFIEELRNFKENRLQIIRNNDMNNGEYILGVYDSIWYISACEAKDDDYVKSNLCHFIKCVLEQYKQEGVARTDYQIRPAYNFTTTFSEISYFRIIAKTAFNCLAYIKGKDFVMDSAFDLIREAICSENDDILKHICLMDYHLDCDKEGFAELFTILGQTVKMNVNNSSHLVMMFNHNNALHCIVSFYGSTSPHVVTLADDFSTHILDGLICDWKNKQEETYMQMLSREQSGDMSIG